MPLKTVSTFLFKVKNEKRAADFRRKKNERKK